MPGSRIRRCRQGAGYSPQLRKALDLSDVIESASSAVVQREPLAGRRRRGTWSRWLDRSSWQLSSAPLKSPSRSLRLVARRRVWLVHPVGGATALR